MLEAEPADNDTIGNNFFFSSPALVLDNGQNSAHTIPIGMGNMVIYSQFSNE
jgi:hypothetical protein